MREFELCNLRKMWRRNGFNQNIEKYMNFNVFIIASPYLHSTTPIRACSLWAGT